MIVKKKKTERTHIMSLSFPVWKVPYLSHLGLPSVSERPLLLWVGPLLPLPPPLGLRGSAVAPFTILTVGGTRGLNGGDRVSLILLLTAAASGLEGLVASCIWTPWRRWKCSTAIGSTPALVVALCMLIGTTLVPHPLCLHVLQDGALTIGAGPFHGGAQPLLFSPRALSLWLGQTCVPAWPPKLDFVSTDDASLLRGNISKPEGAHWCCRLRGSSILIVGKRLIHFFFKGVSSLFTLVSCLWGEKRSNRWKLKPLAQCVISITKERCWLDTSTKAHKSADMWCQCDLEGKEALDWSKSLNFPFPRMSSTWLCNHEPENVGGLICAWF